MLWAALLCSEPPEGVALWALQFTPRVALCEEAVLMEVSASLRLFGGRSALLNRLRTEARALGLAQLSCAPNGLAALALGRAGVANGLVRTLADVLDPLPLPCLSALRPHAPTLNLIGCFTLGALRRLPREGLARRLDAEALRALDQAYGLEPQSHVWITLPERFQAALPLSGRVEHCDALMVGVRRLLLQLCGWLAARHQGVSACTLRWVYDSFRARSVAPVAEFRLHTAQATRDPEHLARLFSEHLARIELAAPVVELRLQADELHPLAPSSASFLPDAARQAESLARVLERLSSRLGPERVQRAEVCEDHRPERMQSWHPAAGPQGAPSSQGSKGLQGLQGLKASKSTRLVDTPQPCFLLPQPLPLDLGADHRPRHQGPLSLLLGPHRIEGAWWDTAAQEAPRVQRDYWVAFSARAGLLWIFQSRLEGEDSAWFLHGFFA